MSDTRGIAERLIAGAKAEESIEKLDEFMRYTSIHTINEAIEAAADYRSIKALDLPDHVAYAGDPLPRCTSLQTAVRLASLMFEITKEPHDDL